jgi:hypothetical protein
MARGTQKGSTVLNLSRDPRREISINGVDRISGWPRLARIADARGKAGRWCRRVGSGVLASYGSEQVNPDGVPLAHAPSAK